MKLELTLAEVKIFSILLNRAGDEMGNNGCNDFSLTRDGGLSEEECSDIDAQLRKTFPNDMQERPDQEDNISDYFLLALLEKKMKSLI